MEMFADTAQGLSAPHIAQAVNPLFQTSSQTQPNESTVEDEYMEEDDDDDHSAAMPKMIRVPMVAMNTVGQAPNPFSGAMMGNLGGGSSSSQPAVNEEWISFFDSIINLQLPEGEGHGATRRILLLESTAAMAETIDVWWPSFMETVRRRRRGSKQLAKDKGKKPASTFHPTTVVLSVAPSLLLPHTAEWREPPSTDAAGETKDRLRSFAEALGASVGSIHVVEPNAKHTEKLWWSSEEHDLTGRAEREERRLRAILRDGPQSLLPWVPAGAARPSPPPSHPILDILMRSRKKDETPDTVMAWKILPIIPASRDLGLEQHERTTRRRAVNAALMMRAVGQLGATLEEPLTMLQAHGTQPPRGRKKRLARRKEPDPEWSEFVIAWAGAVDVASTAVGRAAVKAATPGPIVLKWADIQDARVVHEDHERRIDDTVGAHLAAAEAANAANTAGTTPDKPTKAADKPITDPVIEALKKNKDLNKHEKRLLSCIVDPSKLATASFTDVHLPFKTIDAIRTVISLPLLFPDAFEGGILKEHVTSGALLFGPPGTGKTLLARAIAAESGARMLAIQPSDVNDMWVGEGEKLVKAVFSLARRMSPCVIFLDEVDSLFGARSARDSSGGSKAHNQVLTEFMQEMDGLTSSAANREKRVVVVGATNRPFDLDDAILRRLPRRLLVDLPGLDDRKAILRILLRGESLAADVDIDKIAAETEGFSGSDLKHLCVAAALSAVKDVIDVPWKKSLAGNVSDTVKAAPQAAPESSGGPGAEEVRLLVDEPEPQTEKREVEPEPIDVTANASAAAKRVEEAYVKQLEAKAAEEADVAAARASASSTGTESDSQAAAAKAVDAGAEDGASAETVDGATPPPASEPKPLARTLAAKHFKTALGEIRPSSSEEGTLPELRKVSWTSLMV